MGGKGDEKTVLKPIKPLAVRYNDNRRTLKYYKELLKMKSKRSRLLIMAIADKLNEKEMEILKIRQECDMKLSTIWQQLLHLQGNLNKEQVRLNQVLQDKENIIISQRQEIQRLRHALDLAEKGSGMVTRSASGSFRRLKRDLRSSSTEDSSSPGSSPKQRPQVARSLSSEMTDSGLGQDAKNVNLSRQKLLKGSERPKLKLTNSNSSVTEETKGPKGILKSPPPLKGVLCPSGVKPPVPSRNKVNEKLELRSEERLGAERPQRTASGSSSDSAPGSRVTSEARRVRGQGGLSRDSGNSSLDSSDPSSSMEWRLSVRSTIPILSTTNNNGSSVERTPMIEKKAKPPPPPRRSKSYERPSIQGPNIQQNFEEYDLSTMDCDRALSTSARLKKVSFQESEPGPLRRLPSQPNLTSGLQQPPPPVPARTMFLAPGQDPPTFSSFKGEQKLGHKLLESSSMIQKLDSSSVLSKLLSDSLVTGPNEVRGVSVGDSMAHIDENLNITNIRGDDKYYF